MQSDPYATPDAPYENWEFRSNSYKESLYQDFHVNGEYLHSYQGSKGFPCATRHN